MATLKVNCGGTASKSTARPVGEMRVENLYVLVFAGKRFDELNDFVVNEEAILHDGWSSSERFNRRSNSSNVANSDAGLSIFSASFLR